MANRLDLAMRGERDRDSKREERMWAEETKREGD